MFLVPLMTYATPEPQPTLRDETVVLSPFTMDDIDAHLAGEDEEQARRFGWHPARSTRETVAAAVQRWRDGWRGDRTVVAFAARIGGDLAGGCELRRRDDGVGEMSYWVFPSYRRRGLATRIVRLATGFAFTSLEIERLELYIEPDNDASRGVARSAGFVQEGVLRARGRFGDERRDLVLYARLPFDR